MKKEYKEIISVIKGDIDKLERAIVEDLEFPTSSLNDLLLAPSKRIRPALAFLFLRANGLEITNEQFDLQVAVELAHTASLIHDDIIDFADERRGLETLNHKFNDKIAVLSGDYVLSVALKKITNLNNTEILQEFLSTFSQMAIGEISQYFTKNKIPTMEEYIKKTIQKTAGLFNVALKSSAILAKTKSENWSNFALNFGIAFQIKNDLDNVLTSCSDIKNGTFTAPVIFSNSTEITSDAIHNTKKLINKHILIAQNCIEQLPKNQYSLALKDILELYKND